MSGRRRVLVAALALFLLSAGAVQARTIGGTSGNDRLSGTAGLPARSQAPATKAAEAPMASATRWSTIGRASALNAPKKPSS